jgi:peptidoglycan/xylan/chitin deacetylase (PgdA/CDA1 family)
MRAICLGYHDINERRIAAHDSTRPCPGPYILELPTFREHLTAIASLPSGARVSRFAKAKDVRSSADAIAVLFTCDAGGVGGYTCAADELERRGWRGHFFIITSWIGRCGFMSCNQIRELHARGHVIGSHTVSHPPRMSLLSRDRLMHEWRESRAELSDLLGEDVKAASVANGYYSRIVGSSAAACGIEILFNSEPRTSIAVEDGCLVLGRYSIQAGTTAAESAAIAAGDKWPRLRQAVEWQAKKVVKSLAGERYLAVRARLLSRDADAAKRSDGAGVA